MRRLAPFLFILPMMGKAHESQVAVIDGDMLLLNGRLAHLADIDAPAADQPVGRQAKNALEAMLHGQLAYETVGADAQGVEQIRLYVDGREVNQLLVQQGWARDVAETSPSRYAFAQAVARMERIGIWSDGGK